MAFFSLLLVAAAALLQGCAASGVAISPPAELVSHHAIEMAPDVDVLEVTPEMRAFLDRYVMPYKNQRLRVSFLTLALTDKGILGFHYNDFLTLTAAEAFQRRSGNCVAFANLFVALAREAGLDARYQEVFIEPEWSPRGQTLLVTKHINAVVETKGNFYMIDVSGQNISFESRRRAMSDAEAKAMYFNNLGAESLVNGDAPAAYGNFQRALAIQSDMTDAWSNLGVLFGRNGQPDAAERAYLQTLAIDGREMSAMSNLHDLYVEQGRWDEAAQLGQQVERYRRENPYYLLQLAEEALLADNPEDARRVLYDAIRLKPQEHRLHFALARSAFLAGDTGTAEAALQVARRLAPPEVLVIYQRPLEELVMLYSGPDSLAEREK